MMKWVTGSIYTYFVFPCILLIAKTVSLFNKEIRKALNLRYRVFDELQRIKDTIPGQNKIVLLHAASMGEFEHIKPLITKLKSTYNTSIIVTFFSPSAYENVKQYPGVELFIYLPLDKRSNWQKFYDILKPDIIIISKHDVWPNQIWMAKKYGIPIFLVNASLSGDSSRIRFWVRSFLKYVYRSFDHIFAISTQDMERFAKYFPLCPVSKMGDTKFDQVLLRKDEAAAKHFIPESWTKNSLVILLGSIWPEDSEHILPAVSAILEKKSNIKVIVVPHQPSTQYIESLSARLQKFNPVLFTDRSRLQESRLLVVDVVGVLADLYKYANIAYVGGSFKQGIHNVMEPAIYKIPVLYGPVHTNSFEAINLLKAGGSILLENENDGLAILEDLAGNENKRIEIGEKAYRFAVENLGATERIVKEWGRYLS